MKTLDKKSEGQLYYSSALEGRLDLTLHPESFVEKGEEDSLSVGDLILHADECDKYYQLSGWGDSSVEILVPHDHLKDFFQNSTKLAFTVYDATRKITKTHANKKDGVWFVTLFYEDI